jgi:signal transduction histidine kinase
VATALAARRLADSGGDPDPRPSGRSGLLHPIALWALAAVAPDALVEWLAAEDDRHRRGLESTWFGRDLAGFGLSIARRWGCEPEVLDAVLLAGSSNPATTCLAGNPGHLDRIRIARGWAVNTPWPLPGPRPDRPPSDADRRQLVAEVQSLTIGGLAGPEAPDQSEEVLRDAARLFARNYRLDRDVADLDRRLGAAIDALDLRRDDPGPEDCDQSPPSVPVLDAMAEFAAGAAHELNNPLAIIAGRAQLLQARLDDPDHRRSLQTIISQARRAHQILRDLIYIARPPSPRRVPCVPDQVLRDVIDDLQGEAQSREIRMTCRLSRSPATVSTDPEALRHLADALIRNALEATRPGGEVQLESIHDPRWIIWEVRDDGIGLDEERASHLLDPFYCGRQAGRGLGLGLPRAARFIDQIGGRIGWQGGRGPGTIVRVELPIGEEAGSTVVDPPCTGLRDTG